MLGAQREWGAGGWHRRVQQHAGRLSGLSGTVTAISAASAIGFGGHTCARNSGGALQCWGDNGSGQLGDGTNNDSNAPVTVFASGIAAVSTGGAGFIAITCALTTSGGVLCWGDNLRGQLGDGTNIDSNTPVTVTGLAGSVAAISASFGACAVTTAGLQCWGANFAGGLGDGTNTDSNTPVNVVGLGSKPVQTPTPCGGPCPTPTPEPIPGAVAVDAIGDSTSPSDPVDAKRTVNVGVPFLVSAHVPVSPDVGAGGFSAYQVEVRWNEAILEYLPRPLTAENVWPETCNAVRSTTLDDGIGKEAMVSISCVSSPTVNSSYTGPVIQLEFVCQAPGTSQLTLVAPFEDPINGPCWSMPKADNFPRHSRARA